MYNAFAVSCERRFRGVLPVQSIEAPDENGQMFDRRHDAEFKLLTHFSCTACAAQGPIPQAKYALLYSRMPLCVSCAGAVRQLQQHLPNLHLDVVIGDPIDEPQTKKVTTLPEPESMPESPYQSSLPPPLGQRRFDLVNTSPPVLMPTTVLEGDVGDGFTTVSSPGYRRRR